MKTFGEWLIEFHPQFLEVSLSPGILSCIPAYGRDYRNKKEVQADWDGGKDFEILLQNSSYTNKNNAPKGTTIRVYYNRDPRTFRATKIHIIKVH